MKVRAPFRFDFWKGMLWMEVFCGRKYETIGKFDGVKWRFWE